MSLRTERAAPFVADLGQALRRTAGWLSRRRRGGPGSVVVHGILREDLGEAVVGVVRTGRRGLCWRRRWSLRDRRVDWDRVRSCTVGPDRRLGVPSHTHRLVLEHDEGRLEVSLRGPWGAMALVRLRNRIRAATQLQHGRVPRSTPRHDGVRRKG